MGDYDATLLGAVSRFGPLKKDRLYALYCASDDPKIIADRTAKFEDRHLREIPSPTSAPSDSPRHHG